MSTLELSSLYSSGDIILENPIESSAIFLVVVVICASIEYLFDLAGDVQSKFFQVIFETISEEVLVVGTLSLLLTFGSSFFQHLPDAWAVMFQWTHICLLFMGLMFVVLVVVAVFAVFASNTQWGKFEKTRMLGSPDGLSAREQKFRLAHEKFVMALRANDLPTDVPFADYLLKAEKRNLVALGNLTWKSWLALSTVVVLNALRTRIVPQSASSTDPYDVLTTTDALINVTTFVVLAGYGTLAMFMFIHMSLQHRFRQFLMLNAGQVRARGGEDADDENARPMIENKMDLDDPQSFLLWQNLGSTMSLIQACLMFFVWYSAVFFLNMVYTTFTFDVAVSLLVVIAAVVPVVIYALMLPWTLTMVAALSSLGTSLHTEWVEALVQGTTLGARQAAEKVENKQQQDAERNTVVRRSLRPVVMDDQSLMRLSAANVERKLVVPEHEIL